MLSSKHYNYQLINMVISKKYGISLFAIFLMLHLSSCLTFTETYTFNKNGSGSMEYTIDMSEISSLLSVSSEDEESYKEVIPFAEITEGLQKINGISSVITEEDNENFVYNIGFKFSGLQPLNNAMNVILNNRKDEDHIFFVKEDNVITRKHLYSERFSLESILGEEESNAYAKAIFESVSYELKFEFKNSVKAVYSAADAEIGGKKNRLVNIKASLLDITDDNNVLNTSIVLR